MYSHLFEFAPSLWYPKVYVQNNQLIFYTLDNMAFYIQCFEGSKF